MEALEVHVFYAIASREYSGGDRSLFARVRREYFEKGHCHGKAPAQAFGTKDTVHYKCTRRTMRWVLVSNGRVRERVEPTQGGFALLRWDDGGRLFEKTEFDKTQQWKRTAFYRSDPQKPACVLELRGEDGIHCLQYDTVEGKYREYMLEPVPVEEDEEKNAALNAKVGEPPFLAYTDAGRFYYCMPGEADARRAAADAGGADGLSQEWEPDETWVHLPFSFIRNDHALDDACAPSPDLELESGSGPLDLEWLHEEMQLPPDLEDAVVENAVPDEPAVIEWEGPLSEKLAESSRETPAESLKETPKEAPKEKPAVTAPQPFPPVPQPAPAPPRTLPPRTQPDEDPAAMQPPAALRPSKSIQTSSGRYDYFGPLLEGQRQGQGRTQMENGHTAYEGGFLKDKRDGFGTYYYRSGKLCYAGHWKQNQRDGFGVSFSARDGSLFVGQWKDNRPTGMGAAFDARGELTYYGGWLDGVRDGQGTEYRAGKVVYEGAWQHGSYSGRGCLHLPDGGTLTGAFRAGRANGACEQRSASGELVRTGVWKDGAFVSGVHYADGKPTEIVRALSE